MLGIPDFSAEEQQIAEEVLTELLVLALTVRPVLRDYIGNLCDGVADTLQRDAVDRSRQYALFRVKNMESPY